MGEPQMIVERMLARPIHALFESRSFLMDAPLCMKKALCLALAAALPTAAALAQQSPPQQIDVKKLPGQAVMMDEIVVPVPSEIFAVLDKLGHPAWNGVLRTSKDVIKPTAGSGREKIALLLGTVIAEGFIAVEAENSEEVKRIGKSVLALSEAIGVKKAVVRRSNSIIEYADKTEWQQVRKELDGALADVKGAMTDIGDEALAQMVSLGGWMRGTEALTQVIGAAYTKESAELLHQPVLVEFFERRINGMTDKRKHDPLIMKVQEGLKGIRPLMGVTDGADISEKTVKEIGLIASDLVKGIQQKSSNQP